MPRKPTDYTDLVHGTSDGFRRTVRYKTSSSSSWTAVDLSAATAVHVYLINEAGTVVHEFEGVGDDAALFTLGDDGVLEFQAALTTFDADDIDSYILRVKVTNTDWPAGKVFAAAKGVRIIAMGA